MKYFLFISTAFLLVSCSNYEFKKTEEFNLEPNALKNNTIVELVHTTEGPDFNSDRSYYYQYIVKPKGSNDLIRVLTVNKTDFEMMSKLGGIQFLFGYGTEYGLGYIEGIVNKDSTEHILDKSKIISKVCVSKEFWEIETSDIPTTFGNFAGEPQKGRTDQEILEQTLPLF